MVWLFLRERTDLFSSSPKRLLHFAPEPFLAGHFKSIPAIDYVSADLYDPTAMLKADIMDLDLPDESFDVIYCSHVLEHVMDDRKAMRECRRVMTRNGYGIFMVPIGSSPTEEDTSITDPKERERRFGQHDHVRQYGPDFVDRLIEAGFDVEVHTPRDVAGADVSRFAIRPIEGPIYFCRPNASGPTKG